MMYERPTARRPGGGRPSPGPISFTGARPRFGATSQVTPAKGELTSRGWYVVGGMVVMTLVAFLFGVEEFYALAASSCAALLSAAVWLRRRRRIGLDATIDVAPRRAAAGGSASAQFVLVNSGRRRVPVVCRSASRCGTTTPSKKTYAVGRASRLSILPLAFRAWPP